VRNYVKLTLLDTDEAIRTTVVREMEDASAITAGLTCGQAMRSLGHDLLDWGTEQDKLNAVAAFAEGCGALGVVSKDDVESFLDKLRATFATWLD
jgi:hypothetical protein